MTSEPGASATYRDWNAHDRENLRATWLALVGSSEGGPPTFRDEVIDPRKSGWVFERWVLEAFRLDGVQGYHRFASPMTTSGRTREEIDGLVYDGWQGFLIEAKNEGNRVGIDPIFRLHLMAEQRPIGTMGLMFSMSGFTDPAIELAERLRPIRILLFDRNDLDWAITPEGGMLAMVRRKWTLALRSGRPHIAVTESTPPFGEP